MAEVQHDLGLIYLYFLVQCWTLLYWFTISQQKMTIMRSKYRAANCASAVSLVLQAAQFARPAVRSMPSSRRGFRIPVLNTNGTKQITSNKMELGECKDANGKNAMVKVKVSKQVWRPRYSLANRGFWSLTLVYISGFNLYFNTKYVHTIIWIKKKQLDIVKHSAFSVL